MGDLAESYYLMLKVLISTLSLKSIIPLNITRTNNDRCHVIGYDLTPKFRLVEKRGKKNSDTQGLYSTAPVHQLWRRTSKEPLILLLREGGTEPSIAVPDLYTQDAVEEVV